MHKYNFYETRLASVCECLITFEYICACGLHCVFACSLMHKVGLRREIKSRMIQVIRIQAVLKQTMEEFKISPSERWGESRNQMDRKHILCHCLQPKRPPSLYVSRGCENIPAITTVTLPAVIKWKEILWVCLLASVYYSGTILPCLFSETGDFRLPHHTDQIP